MKFRNRLLIFFAAASLSVSTMFADTVILKNGDRATGAIIKKEGANLTVKTENMGSLVIPWDKIQSIVTESSLNVVLTGGKTVQGVFSMKDNDAEVISAGETIKVSAADITFLRNDAEQKAYERLLNPGWLNLWTGTGSFGIAGTFGNAKTATYTAGLNAGRVTRKDKTTLYFSAITASAMVDGVDKDTAESVRGGVSYNHNLNSRLFYNAFNDYEYDRFQNLDLRFVIGGGLGYQIVNTDRQRLDFQAGVSYNHSKFNQLPSRDFGEIYWGDEYRLKLSSATSLVQSFRMFHNITDPGPYRMNLDLDLNTKIFRWLSWKVSVSDRFLSDPVPGNKRNDFLYTTGVVFNY